MKLLVITIILIGILSCNKPKSIKETRTVLGTIVTIDIKDGGSKELLDSSFTLLSQIENKMSTKIENSEVQSINNSALETVTVSSDTLYVIKRGLYYGDISEGLFDISIGPLVDLWDINGGKTEIPSEKQIEITKSRVNYNDIEIDGFNVSIKEGMSIDLGGIAKGYAADMVAQFLLDNGVEHAIVNLGGNIRVIGSKVDGSPYRIGIQNPFDSRNSYLGIIEIVDKTVVSSGDYERFFEKDGIRYHHILSKETGFPIISNVSAVSVITKLSIDADALSTIFFALDIKDGFKLAKELGGIDLIYITKNKNVYISTNLANKFTLVDECFSLEVTE